MTKCRICDHNAPDDSVQCPQCGAPLESDTSDGGNPDEAEFLQLLEAGRKLEAVKLYREKKGVSLAEAKQAVETLAAKHGVVSQGGGCAGVLLAVMLTALGAGVAIC